MKSIYGVIRIFVGILFFISGFIKINDPLGFSYKLQEYFGSDVLNLEFLIPIALLLSVFLCIFEILLGIALILGYLKKFTLWSLLLMIVFFTFLTFYSWYFEKVTDCGCFGDALPLTPLQSFIKDVILTVLIAFLYWKREYLTPLFAKASHKWIIFVSFIACLAFSYHVLMHLPAIDFRAYKGGTDITEAMKPDPTHPAVYNYKWIFEKDGEEYELVTRGDYPKTDGTYKRYELEMIDPGYTPPITDFYIYDAIGTDLRTQFMDEDKLLIVVAYNLSKSESDGWVHVIPQVKKAMAAGYKVIALSASGADAVIALNEKYGTDIQFYGSDETVLKAMVRSNPGLVTFKKGVITDKLHWNDADALDLN